MSIIETKRYYVVGMKGEIVGVYDNPLDASRQGKSTTPIFEFVPVNMGEIQAAEYQATMHMDDEWDRENVRQLAQQFYCQRDDYGCFGDVIQISRHRVPVSHSYIYTVDSMMWRAYIKPGLASDLVLFVRDRNDKVFLILIRRKNEPGVGTIAAPGGFLNVGVYDIETGARCALREGSEEISVGMSARVSQSRSLDDPNVDGLLISVDIDNKKVSAALKYLGIYVTEKKERIAETNCNKLQIKRVYWTFAYATVVNIDSDLDAVSAAALFKASDDAREVIAVPYGDIPVLELGLKHHRKFIDDAMAYVKRNFIIQ
ncbi:MAG: hypothetical protein WC848_05255 [Parcubacteria group bacterium]|jgi:ADP-ribose pyrophosphatase YjhB (NUDIX family)